MNNKQVHFIHVMYNNILNIYRAVKSCNVYNISLSHLSCIRTIQRSHSNRWNFIMIKECVESCVVQNLQALSCSGGVLQAHTNSLIATDRKGFHKDAQVFQI